MPPESRLNLWFFFVALLAIAMLSFAGWLGYLLVMHFTHGGAS
jgi:hypothetical protein